LLARFETQAMPSLRITRSGTSTASTSTTPERSRLRSTVPESSTHR
jgi:hypothetical protein